MEGGLNAAVHIALRVVTPRVEVLLVKVPVHIVPVLSLESGDVDLVGPIRLSPALLVVDVGVFVSYA